MHLAYTILFLLTVQNISAVGPSLDILTPVTRELGFIQKQLFRFSDEIKNLSTNFRKGVDESLSSMNKFPETLTAKLGLFEKFVDDMYKDYEKKKGMLTDFTLDINQMQNLVTEIPKKGVEFLIQDERISIILKVVLPFLRFIGSIENIYQWSIIILSALLSLVALHFILLGIILICICCKKGV